MEKLTLKKHLKTVFYEINSTKFQDGFMGCRIAMLCDLHCNEFGEGNEILLDEIRKQKPDLILIGGDMLTAKPKERFDVPIDFLRILVKEYPIYYALGNHEYRLRIYPEKYGSMYDTYMNAVKEMGVQFLHNERTLVELNGGKFWIYGLEIDRKYYNRLEHVKMDKEYLKKEIGLAPENEFTVLLAHNPTYFPIYADWGSDLVLSGHNHGGIIRIPFIGGLISPQMTLFPKYDMGEFKEGTSTMILSSGLGTHTIKLRILNPPQLVIVDLK